MDKDSNNRTQQALRRGASALATGRTDPFIRWGDDQGFVEGRIRQIWENQHGSVAQLTVSGASEGLTSTLGSGDQDHELGVSPGDSVNLSVSHAALRGRVTAELEGKWVHVAFEGWGEKGDRRFRLFTVLTVPTDENGQGLLFDE